MSKTKFGRFLRDSLFLALRQPSKSGEVQTFPDVPRTEVYAPMYS